MEAPPKTIGIAGSGRVAQAMGRALRDRGVAVTGVASRNFQHAEAAAQFIGTEAVSYANLVRRADRILIAVSDDAVPSVARIISESGMRSGTALHTSGSQGAEALALTEHGVACGMLHPLQTFASPEQGVAVLPGATFAISGDLAAAAWAAEIVCILEGRVLRIHSGKAAIYHAAAVMASNCVVALMGSAVELMAGAGIGEEEALAALGPLARTSVENALSLGPKRALTGPIQRGDVQTVRRQLEGMRGASAETQALYRAAGNAALRLTTQSNAEIEELLNG